MIEINNLTATPIDEDFVKRVVETVLIGENKPKKELSIALVGPSRIKKINKKYRRENQVTDVLSFSESEIPIEKFEVFSIHEKENLGEIVICLKRVRKNAKRRNLDFEVEFVEVLIHGILHLLGYDHRESKQSKNMKDKQNLYNSKILTN